MMRKLRTFLAALLLVPVLFSNASAFTAESDAALNPARPPSAVCWINIGGMWIPYYC